MQTVINRFAALDKTIVKQFVTVVGVIGFFILSIVAGALAVFAETPDAAIGFLISAVVVGAITGIVGKEFFANV